MKNIIDLAIIGAGPAGMAAGIYMARTGKSIRVFEKLAPGGQAALTYSIENYPGFEEGINGFDLTDKMRQQVENQGGFFEYDSVESYVQDPMTKIYTLTTGVGNIVQARAILIATGTSSRRLGVKGEDKFFGRGIGTCAVCDGAFYKDKVVAVIGGGNSALDESLYLANIASKVYIVHRRDEFRAEQTAQDKVKQTSNIELLTDTVVEEFIGDQKLNKFVLKNVKTEEVFEKDIDGVFLYVGLIPNTELVEDKYKDQSGFIKIDSFNRMNDSGLFAAGDCCVDSIKQVVIACSEGAKATYSVNNYLNS